MLKESGEISKDEPYSLIEYDKIFLDQNILSDNTEIAKKSLKTSTIKDTDEFIENLLSFAEELDLNTLIICQEQLKDLVVQ